MFRSSSYFGPFPETTIAYYTDGTDEWYGEANKGANTFDARWKITKQEYSGDNWIIKYPNGSSEPKFKWDDVATLSYKLLGT